VQDDIRTVDPRVLEGVYGVCDLAALSNDPAGELDPDKTYQINHEGRARIAKLAKQAGARRYVLASSCSIYGFQDEAVNETSETNPLTAYAKANLNAERSNLPLGDDDFCATVLRQATVFGRSRRMRFDLAINGMVRGLIATGKLPILRDGTQWRPMVHVRDTCRAFATVMEADPQLVNGQIFNVGADWLNLQIMPLARTVAEAIGLPFNYEWYGDPDHRSYRVSFAKIKRILGFEPEWDAARGAADVAAGIRSGEIDPDDPRTITLDVYKKLLEQDPHAL
jgi:nucleoside-diphosphate-sugar epimerase